MSDTGTGKFRLRNGQGILVFWLSVLLGGGLGGTSSYKLIDWRVKALEELTSTAHLVNLERRLKSLENEGEKGARFTALDGERHQRQIELLAAVVNAHLGIDGHPVMAERVGFWIQEQEEMKQQLGRIETKIDQLRRARGGG